MEKYILIINGIYGIYGIYIILHDGIDGIFGGKPGTDGCAAPIFGNNGNPSSENSNSI